MVVIRARCPRCGRMEAYEPGDEDLSVAREVGVASVSFFHDDHVFVVFFDPNGMIRRALVIRAAGPSETTSAEPSPAMPLSALCSLLGEEALALALAALAADACVLVTSSSRELAGDVARSLTGLLGAGAEIREVTSSNELRAACDGRGASVVVADRHALAGPGELPSGAVLLDLDARARPDKKAVSALKPLVEDLRKALGLEGEEARHEFIRLKLARLRSLYRKALEVLQGTDMIEEASLVSEIEPGLPKEELQLLYLMLERFGGIDVSRCIIKGLSRLRLRLGPL